MVLRKYGRDLLWLALSLLVFLLGLGLISGAPFALARPAVSPISQPSLHKAGEVQQGAYSVTLTETPGCGPWSIVPSVNPSPNGDIFRGIAAISPNDVWAVGAYSNSYRTVIEHWDGTQWSDVQSPGPIGGSTNNQLYAVAAISSNDVWAVGFYMSNALYQPLIEHWDGTTWSIVSSPGVGSYNTQLYAVAAVGANDVWAVGYYASTPYTMLTEHWDGTTWSIVAAPSARPVSNVLTSVVAVSTNDVWAAGVSPSGVYQTVIEHWDGAHWSVIPSPSPGSGGNGLYAVAAAGPGDIWAAGWYFDSGNPVRPLTEHWDGTAWTVVPSPGAGTGQNPLTGLAVVSANDVWAVGTSDENLLAPHKLTLHWDGTGWSTVSDPNVNSAGDYLYAVTAISNNAESDVWAAGWSKSGTAQFTLTERYACLRANSTSTPSLTPPPSPNLTSTYLPTDTPTDTSTNTPTNTPTTGCLPCS